MPKNNRHGKAALISERDWNKIKSALEDNWFKTFVHIAYFSGERWGAICQLAVEDVYINPQQRQPKTHITFRKETRKGKDKTRQVPVHRNLRTILKAYDPPLDGYLFPAPQNSYKSVDFSTADKALRRLLNASGLGDRGISTHSFRRSLITNLSRAGVDVKSIQQITGHSDTGVLMGYIEEDERRIKAAIASLPG